MTKKQFLTLPLLLAGFCGVQAQPKLTENNIDEVIAAMTLEEKAAVCVGVGWGQQLGGITGSSTSLVPGAAGTTHAIPRLGIPATAMADGPAGIRINPTREGDSRTYYGTGFPIATMLASSWDTALVEEVTAAMGNEVLEYGADVLLAPAMNIHRNPLCGRNFEYFSEDPFLTGKMGAAYIRGVQSAGVGTSMKHFAANNQETNRLENDSRVDERTLRELYLKGFEIAVKEAEPWTVMSSYNKLDGEYTQQSHDLLTKVLRDEWGYNGMVVTDWGNKDGTVKAVIAGNDMMMPGSDEEQHRIIDAVRSGELPVAELDRNVKRVLEYIVKTPHFRNYAYSDAPDLDAHAEVARRAAAESMVLLKNEDGLLPLHDVNKVALFGISSVDFVAGGTGSGNVNKKYVVDLVQGLENAGFELDSELVDFNTRYVDWARISMEVGGGDFMILGTRKIPEVSVPRSFVDRLASRNDLAIVVIGRNAGEGRDRTVNDDFNLSDTERQLLDDVVMAFSLAGKKTVVVLNIGGVIETVSWKHLPDAILLAWQPGQEGGNAIADVLTGKVNPSGKLPMTFPLAYTDHPSSRNFPSDATSAGNRYFRNREPVRNYDYTAYEEGLNVGYRYFTTAGKEVSYPFGFGLSYTEFEYSRPVAKVDAEGNVTASVTVTNTGKTAGRETVQLYVSAPSGGLEKPVRELKAFAKTRLLQAGESQTLEFKVDAYGLASFNPETNCWETAQGNYTVYFSHDVDDTALYSRINVKRSQSFEVSDAGFSPLVL